MYALQRGRDLGEGVRLVVFVCDRCGARSEDRLRSEDHYCQSISPAVPSGEFVKNREPEDWSRHDHNLLCPACASSLKVWWTNGTVKKQEEAKA